MAIVLIVVVAVAGAGAYFALSGPGPSSTTTASSSSSSSSAGTTTVASTSPSTTTSSESSQSISSSSVSSSISSQSSASISSTTSYSTFSCTTTYATSGGGAPDYTPQYIDLISKFSAITFTVTGSYNGTQNENATISYKSTVVSAGIYDVNMTFSSSQGTESGVARVDSNNESVISVTFSGYSFYGAQAKSFFDGLFALFGLEYTFGAYVGILTNSAYFHSTGTSSMTFGPTSFSVTTWVANSLPLSINECGYSSDITDYTLQIGTPPGTSLSFITYLHYASDSPTSENFTFSLVSMTAA